MTNLWSSVRVRVVLFAGVCGGLAQALLCREPVSPDVISLAARLTEETGFVVEPNDLRWEPTEGILRDAFLGRGLLYLGRRPAEAARDVFRASVRLSPNGRPLGIRFWSNLTSTDDDDHSLVVRGANAAFVRTHEGQVQGVTLFHLDGEGRQNLAASGLERVTNSLSNLQSTGSLSGIARTDVTFEETAVAVGLALEDERLRIDLRTPSSQKSVSIRLDNHDVDSPTSHIQEGKHLGKPFVFWAVDTVRAVSWIGPGPIAWLESKVFYVRDFARRTAFQAKGGGGQLAVTDSAVIQSDVSESLDEFPPRKIVSIWKDPASGEGEWITPSTNFLKSLSSIGPEKPPAAFARTFVEPDEERRYSKVFLVAMDMRQLELDMEAGVEDPKPLSGPPGSGRIPRDPAVYRRVAAAFNGGFKTEHGSYGMMVHKRVLLPPVAGAATVAVLDDGRVAMGSWGNTTKVGGIQGVRDEQILSFRQNLEPLVENDVLNPSGRTMWGFTLPGTSMQTERSGICVTRGGHLIYAWGDDVSGPVLAKAMKMGGCSYGMHLDMNPHHTGYVFSSVEDFKGKAYKSELLSPKMEISPDRFLEYSPKDFFYVMFRDVNPPSVGDMAWTSDAGHQPSPKWMPTILVATLDGVSLRRIRKDRVVVRARAGSDEPGERALEKSDEPNVLLAVTLGGVGERKLYWGGKKSNSLVSDSGMGVLSLDKSGVLALKSTADWSDTQPAEDAIVLPLLIANGNVTPEGEHRGATTALGVASDGSMYIASSDAALALAEVLKHAGCVSAVALDRAGVRAHLYRAGTPDAPRERYARTTLSFVATKERPGIFHFLAENPVLPKDPRKKK